MTHTLCVFSEMSICKNVKDFVPLFASEREAGRVKEIRILGEIPIYLISLIEHKTEVDYNIHMQIFRAFLLNVNVPVDETEELTELVKERKMGQLFANAEKMDIQAERKKTEEANRKVEEAIDRGVKLFALGMQELGKSKEVVIERIQAEYGLTKEVVEEKVNQYWKN